MHASYADGTCIRELTHSFSIPHTTHSSHTSDSFLSGNTTSSFKTNRAITIYHKTTTHRAKEQKKRAEKEKKIAAEKAQKEKVKAAEKAKVEAQKLRDAESALKNLEKRKVKDEVTEKSTLLSRALN